MRYDDDTLCNESVLARTPDGARLVLEGMTQLNEGERRLLLLANGFTPLQTLMDLTGAEPVHTFPAAQALVLEGFAELVK